MPPELTNNEELSLKKRARRRLVGAIALVMLMIIVLPMILQDRASLAPQDAIKITMPEVRDNVINTDKQVLVAPTDEFIAPEPPIVADEPSVPDLVSDGPTVSDKAGSKKSEVENEKVVKLAEPKPEETKTQQKNNVSFAIQVGVYSDAANVKQLQAKLKDTGFTSQTEKISTAKGEKIRLKVGSYHTRQEAADALVKLQASGISGMVVSN